MPDAASTARFTGPLKAYKVGHPDTGYVVIAARSESQARYAFTRGFLNEKDEYLGVRARRCPQADERIPPGAVGPLEIRLLPADPLYAVVYPPDPDYDDFL
jgi:hypothetical protein